jgi:hypothetical protein
MIRKYSNVPKVPKNNKQFTCRPTYITTRVVADFNMVNDSALYGKPHCTVQSTAQQFLSDGELLAETLRKPSNQHQHTLVAITDIYVPFKPLVHVVVITPFFIGSGMFYIFIISFLYFSVSNLCILYF